MTDELFRSGGHMPERDCWQRLCAALRQKSYDEAGSELVAIRTFLRRRSRGEVLPHEELYPEEHRLAPAPALGDAWNAYKAAVRASDFVGAREHIHTLETLLRP